MNEICDTVSVRQNALPQIINGDTINRLLPLAAILLLTQGGSAAFSASSVRTIMQNPELGDMLRDLSSFVPREAAQSLGKISAAVDFASRIRSDAEIEVMSREEATPLEIYSTMKRYIPLPYRQKIDTAVSSMSAIRGISGSGARQGSDSLDSIINTLTGIRNIRRSMTAAGSAARIINSVGGAGSQSDTGEQKLNTDALAELMKGFLGSLSQKQVPKKESSPVDPQSNM